MITKRLGNYEILEELGSGGMATVYRAYHPTMDRFVAIKVLRDGLADDKVHLNRFNKEARVIARLEHPHLLPVYDFSGDSDPAFIVMRYLEGVTLKQVCESAKGKLPLHEITHIVRQIAAALDYAHSNGVIHRDIKPSNIMIDTHGNCFLTDFGIASIMGEGKNTKTGTLVGTPAYMSPEQIVGEEALTPSADTYSLAVVVFELATGRQPYTASSLMGIMRQHVEAPVPSARKLNPNLPPAFDKVMRKALAKKSAVRFATATDLARSLEALLAPDEAFLPPDTLKKIALKEVNRLRANRTETQVDAMLLNNPEQSEAMKETIKLLETPGRPITAPIQRQRGGSCLYYVVGLIVFVAFTAILLSFIGLPTQNESDIAATRGVQTRAALALVQTATAQPRATATPTATPTVTPTPTATVPMQANQLGNAYLNVLIPEPTLVFAQGEFFSADHAFQIDLNHVGTELENARIFAEPNSRILVDDVNSTGIRFAAAKNSRFIVYSGGYDTMEIGFDNAPLTFLYIEEDQACAAVDYTPVNALYLDCLEGTCTYTLNGSSDSRVALRRGQRVIVRLPEQNINNILPIPVEALLHYEEFLTETGSGMSQLGCVEPLLPTPTPTVAIVIFPTAQAQPVRQPYR